jgi:hypothetical protein
VTPSFSKLYGAHVPKRLDDILDLVNNSVQSFVAGQLLVVTRSTPSSATLDPPEHTSHTTPFPPQHPHSKQSHTPPPSDSNQMETSARPTNETPTNTLFTMIVTFLPFTQHRMRGVPWPRNR